MCDKEREVRGTMPMSDLIAIYVALLDADERIQSGKHHLHGCIDVMKAQFGFDITRKGIATDEQ